MAEENDFPPKLHQLNPSDYSKGGKNRDNVGGDIDTVMVDDISPSHYKAGCDAQGISSNGTSAHPRASLCHFTTLPTELVDLILCFLDPVDLASTSMTCRYLYNHANADHVWQALVQANVPGLRVTSPFPCSSYKELYTAHDQRWFLPKHKIWFSDRDLVGRLIVVRYDPRRGCIEGYQLVAFSHQDTVQPWAANQSVEIHTFKPDIRLHLDKPVLQLEANSLENIMKRAKRGRPVSLLHRDRDLAQPETSTGSHSRQHRQPDFNWPRPSRFQAEMPMVLGSTVDGMFSNFMYAKPLMPSFATHRASFPFPYGDVWPPPAIPASERVAGVTLQMIASGAGRAPHRPADRSEVSDRAFRIRSWVELGGPAAAREVHASPHSPFWANAMLNLLEGPPSVSVHIGEEIATYATLDPALYTPTKDKPWRGIWVGDYSGHGCEFLLINQPDNPPEDLNSTANLKHQDETEEEYVQRRQDSRVYCGRLEAIKLTGDPNVPRGEHTFIADDLGDAGYVTTIREEPFKGARVVKSRGHIANTGFENDHYIESQLILISPNRLAQYWVGFAHISFFERVDIDDFLVPE